MRSRCAAEQAGFPRIDDFNRGDNAGVSYFDVNQRGRPARELRQGLPETGTCAPNLTVWTPHADRTAAARDDQRAHPLLGRDADARQRARRVSAARELILAPAQSARRNSCSCPASAPRRCCASTASRCVHDAPGVGANLQDHLQIRPVFKVRGVRTFNELASTWYGPLRIGLEYALRRTGPMSMAPSQLGAFVRSDPSRPHANLQYHVQPLSPARLRPAHRPLSRHSPRASAT